MIVTTDFKVSVYDLEGVRSYIIMKSLSTLKNHLNENKYNMWNKYLHDNKLIKRPLLKEMTDIILNIKCSAINNRLAVSLKDDKLYRLISYGNRSIRGWDILKEALGI